MGNNTSRRNFIKTTGLFGVGMMANPLSSMSDTENGVLDVACQTYTWYSYYNRENKVWEKDVPSSFADLKKAGFKGYEPSFKDTGHVSKLTSHLSTHHVAVKSMYVNSLLHDEKSIEESIKSVLAIAKEARKIGVEIVVTNPQPIEWGKAIYKDDKQLKLQARSLNILGQKLRGLGMKLAYHNHDIEMRQSAREFHHMMLNTDPENVFLCLDAHWIYRGAGNSQIALFDIMKLYDKRIVELHLRQSKKGIWSEVFGDGDIDYNLLAEKLLANNIKPHLVLEQAVEKGTPHTLGSIEAIGKSLDNVKEVFRDFK